MEKKAIAIILPEIGEVEVLLTEEQFNISILKGKKYYDREVEDGISFHERLRRIREKSNTTLETEGGFTNNKENWESFFPDISFETISNTVEEAREKEESLRENARIACSLIEIAFAAYIGGTVASAMEKLKSQPKNIWKKDLTSDFSFGKMLLASKRSAKKYKM